jgi:hypothetical protein
MVSFLRQYDATDLCFYLCTEVEISVQANHYTTNALNSFRNLPILQRDIRPMNQSMLNRCIFYHGFCSIYYRWTKSGKRPIPYCFRSRDSAVGIAAGYGLDDWGVWVRVPVEARIFYSVQGLDWFWGPISLLSNGQRWLFPRGYSGLGVKLTTQLQPLPKSRKHGCIYPLHQRTLWRGVN